MKDISKILSALGLLDSEIKTYMAALRNGPSTVLDLTKLTHLSRQAIYTAIEALSHRGLMSSVQHGKKQFYTSERPNKLLSHAKRKETELAEQIKDLENILPELELQAGGEKPVVKVFEGKEGLRAILEDTRASKPLELHEITDVEAMNAILTTEDLIPYKQELGRIGTKIYTFIDTPKQDEPNIKRVKLSKEEAGFKAHIGVHGDKIALITFEGKMYSIIIENKGLAQGLRTLFQRAYKSRGA